MEKIIITEKDVLEAKASIPLTLKWALAKYIAEWSVEKKSLTVVENGQETIPLPEMYQRRTMIETQFKIGVFVKEYLGREFDPVHESGSNSPVTYLMAADEADAWANFETQLDRLKRSKNKDIVDKCYDILNDYHAFVRMVSIEIEQELQVRNDVLGRAVWLLSYLVGKMTPDELLKNVNDISNMVAEIAPEDSNSADSSKIVEE